MEKPWVETIRDQCKEAGVPFFFKQWGGFQKKKTGRLLDGRLYDERPKPVAASIPNTAHRRALLARAVQDAPLADLFADISNM